VLGVPGQAAHARIVRDADLQGEVEARACVSLRAIRVSRRRKVRRRERRRAPRRPARCTLGRTFLLR
jgi:hypothetical protein